MHMAFNEDEWIKLNTSYCHRLCAWISSRTCDVNRERSVAVAGDLRCVGCNGLHDQTPELDPLGCSLKSALEAVLHSEVDTEEQGLPKGDQDVDEQGLFRARSDEDEVDAELLAMFPELQELFDITDPEPPSPEDREHESLAGNRFQMARKRCAVFSGRCKKCNGYMINDIERHDGIKDDDVYRCFTCGWRISPVYAWNRHMGV
jgi:hypothetical protein